MSLTGTYAENVQYLIEMGENIPLANDPTETDIPPQLDSEGRPVIGFGYDLLANVNSANFASDLEAAGVSSSRIAALTAFLNQHKTTPYSSSELTTLQGLASIPTQADAVTLLQISIATAESGLNTLTEKLGIGNIPDSNERAALVDMYYQLPGGGGTSGKNGYFMHKDGSFTNLSLALQSGNRAEAWFQIRYQSSDNGINGNGVVKRRYVDAQLYGLFADPSSPTEAETLQAYQMLTAHRSMIMSYEAQFGVDPYGSDPLGQSTVSGSTQLEQANSSKFYGLAGTPNQVQTLAQVFAPAATEEIQYLESQYSNVLPGIQLSDSPIVGGSGFNVSPVDFFATSPTDEYVNAGISDASTQAEQLNDEEADHILLGSETGDVLIGALGSDILIAQQGNEELDAGRGQDTLIAANGNDTIKLGYQPIPSADVLDFVFPSSSGVVESFTENVDANGSSGLGTIDVNGTSIGAGLIASIDAPDTWADSSGNTYKFISSTNQVAGYSPAQNGQNVGEMKITLGDGNQIDIQGFNLTDASDLGVGTGFLGIYTPPILSLTAGANAGVDPPAPNFTAGSSQSYTVYVDAPSSQAQTVTVTLSGVPASDFGLASGTGVTPLGSNGTFTVTIAAGQTSAAFTLVNTGDVGKAAGMTLTASMANPGDSTGSAITSETLTQSYVEPSPDPFLNNATSTVTGKPTADPNDPSFVYNQYKGGASAGQSEQILLSGSDNYVLENGENDFITGSRRAASSSAARPRRAMTSFSTAPVR